METVPDWRQYLETASDAEMEKILRKATLTGRPCVREGFVRKTETDLGRRLLPRPRGQPRRQTYGVQETLEK